MSNVIKESLIDSMPELSKITDSEMTSFIDSIETTIKESTDKETMPDFSNFSEAEMTSYITKVKTELASGKNKFEDDKNMTNMLSFLNSLISKIEPTILNNTKQKSVAKTASESKSESESESETMAASTSSFSSSFKRAKK